MRKTMRCQLILLSGVLVAGALQADRYWTCNGIDFADAASWQNTSGNWVFGGHGPALKETGEGGVLCTFSKAVRVAEGLWVETQNENLSVIWKKADDATDDAGLTVGQNLTIGTGMLGHLVVKSGTYTAGGELYVANGTSVSSLSIEAAASLSSMGECVFALGKNAQVDVQLNGGRFMPSKLWIGSRYNATADACSATFTMNGGYLETKAGNDIVVGGNNNATGAFIMNEGEVRCGKQFFVSWRGNGSLTMKGGDIYIPAAYNVSMCGDGGAVSSDVKLYGGRIHTDNFEMAANGTRKSLLVDGGGFAPVSNKGDWLSGVSIPVGLNGVVLDTDGFDAILAATLVPTMEGEEVKVIKRGEGCLTLPTLPENLNLVIEEGTVKVPTGATLAAVATGEKGALFVDPAEDAEATLLTIKGDTGNLSIFVTGCEKVVTVDDDGHTLVKAGAALKVEGEPCVWTGAYTTDWFEPRNWSWNAVPADNEPVEIPEGKKVCRNRYWETNAQITGSGEIVMAKAEMRIKAISHFADFRGTLTIEQGCFVWDDCGLHGEGGDTSSFLGRNSTVRLAGGRISRFGGKGLTSNEYVYDFEVVKGTENVCYNYESRDWGGANVRFTQGIRGGGKLVFGSSHRSVAFSGDFSDFTGELELSGESYAFSSFQNGTCRVKSGANLGTSAMAVGGLAKFFVEGDTSWVNYTIAADGTFGGGANTKVASIAFDPEAKFTFIDEGALSDTTVDYVGLTSTQPIETLPKRTEEMRTARGAWRFIVRENTTTTTDEASGETTTTVESYSLCGTFRPNGLTITIR